ncbi:MAG: 50S ribosomal protein L18 [Bacteroidetes bacterium QS_7_67_15]|jgi:large subunit ribosomal protein L18|nr:MAG: 50S ribosomal protein L18 [Bacteroidetes bacterium QS_7_67_15]
MPKSSKQERRHRVHRGLRKDINGTSARPRLSVYRSNKHIYAQLIDDIAAHTMAAASSREEGVAEEDTRTEQSHAVGELLAERAQEEGIGQVVFDRSGYPYHGRVKALAEGAREAGLTF